MVTEGTPTGLPATAFFSKTYDEAMALAIEARDYFAHLSSAEARDLGPATGLEYCRESSRLTTQLTQVMAWLLAQRAVHEGEMTLDEARSEAHRLAAAERCLADEGARHGRASGRPAQSSPALDAAVSTGRPTRFDDGSRPPALTAR